MNLIDLHGFIINLFILRCNSNSSHFVDKHQAHIITEELRIIYYKNFEKNFFQRSKREHFHSILRLFDVLPNLSPQVNQCQIITYKHGICELPHELPNDLKLRILGN